MIRLDKHRLLEWAVLSFAFFPIIPNGVKWIPTVVLLATSLLHFSGINRNYKWFFLNASLYFFYLISLIYTENLTFAFKKLETALSLLIIPLIVFVILPQNVFNKKLKMKFMKVFSLSSVIFSLVIIYYILTDTSVGYYKDFYSNTFRILVEKAPLIGQHPIYASIYLAIALIFTLNIFLKERNKKIITKFFLAMSILINVIFIIMLSSKGVLTSLIILLLILLFKELLKSVKKLKIILFIVILLSLISLLFMYNRRMNEMLKIDTYGSVNRNYSSSYRIGIYKCAVNIIKKEWLLGYGVGDAQEVLNKCYKEKSELLLEKTYNSHNQFLDIWIKTGILSLLMFLSFLYLNLKLAVNNKNEVLIFILLLFILSFMTENILVRQTGVILFSFLINFLFQDDNKIKN